MDQPLSCEALAENSASGQSATPNQLYAELRTATANAPAIGLRLNGGMGNYSAVYGFSQCDISGQYFVDRLVLVSASGKPVAVASLINPGGNTYSVKFQNGLSVTTAAFANNSILYAPTSTTPVIKVQSISPGGNTIRQGEHLSVQISLSADPCGGVRESQWWLVSATAGNLKSAPAIVSSGSGTARIYISPKLPAAANYYIEGLVTLQSGRIVRIVRRGGATNPDSYQLIEAISGRILSDVGASAVAISVSENAAADSLPPAAVAATAMPTEAAPCQRINLSLAIVDDKGLLPMQRVKFFVGPADRPTLTSVILTGGSMLSGSFVVPANAPLGNWYGYPELVYDAAGNQTRGAFFGKDKFSLIATADSSMTGPPVMAATFVVSDSAASTPNLADMGPGTLPDMSTAQYPAMLTMLLASPSAISKEGDMVTVQMNWSDPTGIL